VKFLRRPPGSPIAVFAQMLYDQPDVFERTNSGFRMPKPETFRIGPDQGRGAVYQSRWRRHRRVRFA